MKKIIILFAAILVIPAFKATSQCNPPKINSFSPITGYIGSTVTITGANFDATPANNQVFFGATQATVLTASFGTLTVTAPVGATTALISVRNNCNKVAYSQVPFNGIFCPTPLTNSTYQNTEFTLSGVYGAYNMLSQDMDLDGKPDIVCAGIGSGITIARNTSSIGNLSFAANNFSISSRGVAVADFDGDGKRDILSSTDGAILVARNTSTPGTISFESNYTAYNGGTWYQCGVGDFNNDGKIDFCSEISGYIYTFLNTSTGAGNISFSINTGIYVTYRCTGIQCADVDGDGLTDILATQGDGSRAITLRNNNTSNSSTFSFESPEAWVSDATLGGSYPYRCQIADFDKDGKIDLTTCNYYGFSGTTSTAIFRNTSTVGNINFATVYTVAAPEGNQYGNYRIQVGDVNGDGFPDIVTKSLFQNTFSVYPNTSSGAGSVSLGSRIDYSSSDQAEVSGIVIGDLDGDFVPDIATSGINSGTIRFHRNTSSQNDNTPPTANCKNITVALSPSGSVTVTAAMIDNGSSDACGIGSILIDNAASKTFTCSDIGTNTVTLKVIDRSNNVSTCTATITVAAAAIITSGQTTVCDGQTVLLTANTGDSYQWYKNSTAISGATNQTYTATTSGNYQVEVNNSGGCSGTSSATSVTVNTNPTVDVTPSGSVPLCNGSVVLSASTSSLYQWKLNGNDIQGATQQSFNATSTGTYSVKVVDLFGCSATSSGIVVNNTPPEIDITGNGNSISDGDNTPSNTDETMIGFYGTGTSTFTIKNTGSGNLHISSITIGGVNPENFTLGGITLPADISVNGSTTFTVTFSLSSLGTKNATVNILNNDCNEALYNFDLYGELSCTSPEFTSCPENIEVSASGTACDAIVTYTPELSGIPTADLSYIFDGATTGSGNGDGSGSNFSMGTTTVTLIASNACGTAVCSFDVIVNGVIPDVTITQSNLPEFCQGGIIKLSANASGGESFDYLWSTEATTQSIDVQSSADYSVIVTNNFGCSGSASTTVDYDATTLLSSYTIIATDEVELKDKSQVKTGGVGAIGCNEGEIEVEGNSKITGSTTFAKAKKIKVNGGSTVTTQYTSKLTLDLPDFQYNPNCDFECKSKNHNHCDSECKDKNHNHCKSSCKEGNHNHCSHKNCKGKNDVTVGSNKTVTLTNDIFGKVAIGKGSTVTFTQPVIYMKDLKTSEGVTIKFTEACVVIMVCDEVELKDDNAFNPTDKSVVIYVEDEFKAKKNSTINASIYSLEEIKVEANSNNITYMKGLFIAEKIKSNNVYWNWNTTCGNCTNLNKKSVFAADEAGLIDPNQISFNVYPNPNKGAFGIDIVTNQTGTLKIDVIDVLGRTIYTETQVLNGPVFVPINLSNAANGQYVVKAEINGKLFTKYVLINKQ